MREESRSRKRKHIPVDIEEVEVRSKYFKKNERTVELVKENKGLTNHKAWHHV